MSYKVRLPVFEGPFDLLVWLIESAQMSIYDIQISEITSQYMDYIHTMQDLNVSLASEFMVLAAELLRIKSKMMLPGGKPEEGAEEEEDPRKDLVRQLVEYRKCRAAAAQLEKAEHAMEDVWTKPQEDLSVYTDHPDEYLSLSIDDFGKAFRQFLHRKKRLEKVRRHYSVMRRERETLENRMRYIGGIFQPGSVKCSFGELVPEPENRRDVIVSFLSVLQMTRDHYLDLDQKSLFGEITVTNGSRSLEDFDARRAAEEEEAGSSGDGAAS